MDAFDEKFTKLRRQFGKSFEDFLNGKYDSPQENNRWTGYVVNNRDPEYRGRVKVLVIGVYDNIPEPSIPWAIPDISYLGSTAGNFIVPEIGTVLRGYFDHSEVNKPIFDSVAFNTDVTDKAQSRVGVTNAADYPNKMILMQTDQGECLTLNRADGETVFKHRSGATIRITAHGDISITAGQYSEAVKGTIHLKTDGNINIESSNGDVDVTTKTGNITVNSEAGMVKLGRNPAMQFVNNLPTCLVTGAPHYVGNTNVQC